MAFPNFAALLDDFNRADEGPPPSQFWSTGVVNVGTPIGGVEVVGNQCCSQDPSTIADGFWNYTMFGPDCEVTVDYPTLAGGGGVYLFLRLSDVSPTTSDGYVLLYADASDIWRIYRIDNAVMTVLGTGWTTSAFAAGDSLGFEAVGSTLTGYKKVGGTWSSVHTRTDGTYSGSGFVGLLINGNTARVDNFSAGPVSVETPTAEKRYTKTKVRPYSA